MTTEEQRKIWRENMKKYRAKIPNYKPPRTITKRGDILLGLDKDLIQSIKKSSTREGYGEHEVNHYIRILIKRGLKNGR